MCSRNVIFVLFILLIMCSAFICTGWAQQINNDNSDPYNLHTWVSNAGNDTLGTGTFTNPYRTLMKAESLSLTGTKSTVCVKAGTYKEEHSFSKPYTWIASGTVILQSASTIQVVAFAANSNIVNIIGFTIDRETTTAGAWIEILANGNNKTITNCTFINPKTNGRGINLNGCMGIVISNCTFNGNLTSGSVIRSATNAANTFTVSYCTFNGANGNTFTSSCATGLDTAVIDHCTFNHYAGKGYAIAKDLNLTFTNNTITYCANVTGYSFFAVAVDANSYAGTLTITNNTIALGAYNYINTGSVGMFDIQGANNAFIVNFSYNTVSSTSSAITKPLLWCYYQPGLIFNHNNIDLHTSAGIVALMTFMPPVSGTTAAMQCNYNEIRMANTSGAYVLAFGNEITSSYNDDINGLEVIGNLIYGHRYYDVTLHGYMHAIFVGFNVDAVIKHNTLIGCGYGIVYKHNNFATMASGGIFYNTTIDCVLGINIKGINGIKVYGNTLISTVLLQNALLSMIPNPNGSANITSIELKNNIFYSKSTGANALINVQEDAGHGVTFESDYNFIKSVALDCCLIGTTGYNFAEWQGAGYDVHGINETPQLTDLTTLTNENCAVNPRPIAESNVIGIGADLGADYDDGLDQSSEPPLIITTQQDSSWDCGAYIHNQNITPPQVPANVRVSLNNSYVFLEWDSSINATEYHVYRSISPYSNDWGTPFATTTQTNWTDTTSLSNLQYFYRITASSNH